jgi:hypothetical protein
MRLHKTQRSTSYYSHTNEEEDREFRDFIESVSVTKEELAAIVGTPEFSSIHEAKESLREGKQNSGPKMNAPMTLSEFQRRFERGWERVAAAFVAAGATNYHPRSPRKS